MRLLSRQLTFKSLLCISMLLLLSACGQTITEVRITPNQPQPGVVYTPTSFITNIDLQGGATTSAVSANRNMSIQSFGGTSLRTSSSSPSFRLTSGIGVD